MKKVTVVGSSGGHLYVLGGKDPKGLLDEVVRQAHAAGIEVASIAFVAAKASLDQATDSTAAELWVQTGSGPAAIYQGTLAEVNQRAAEVNQEIAQAIAEGGVDGLVLISADPKGVNQAVIAAAAEKKIPTAGTGGTSMAEAQSRGCNVISTSGTTGTTNRTRAVGYISALSSEWKLRYTPVIGKVTEASTANLRERINLRSIMMSSLPGFIAMALILAIGKIPFLAEPVGPLFELLVGALPVLVAVIAAKQVSGLEEVGIVAGLVAGTLSVKGGILGGIVGGILAGIFCSYLLQWSFRYRFPATTASLVAGAIGGLVSGLIVYFALAPVALFIGNGIQNLINGALAFSPLLAGALAGVLIWPAIIGGVYHAAILPIVLLEMSQTGHSFFGAVDMTALVMVSAGITLANIVAPRKKSEASVALPGFIVNVGFGTFVEAAYPFMFADRRIFGTALFAGMLSGAACGLFNARGTAYVPSIVAPGLSNNPLGFLISMLIGLGTAFVLTWIFNKTAKKVEPQEEGE